MNAQHKEALAATGARQARRGLAVVKRPARVAARLTAPAGGRIAAAPHGGVARQVLVVRNPSGTAVPERTGPRFAPRGGPVVADLRMRMPAGVAVAGSARTGRGTGTAAVSTRASGLPVALRGDTPAGRAMPLAVTLPNERRPGEPARAAGIRVVAPGRGLQRTGTPGAARMSRTGREAPSVDAARRGVQPATEVASRRAWAAPAMAARAAAPVAGRVAAAAAPGWASGWGRSVAPVESAAAVAQRPPDTSAAQTAAASAPAHDLAALGDWVVDRLTHEANRPPAGLSGPDDRLTPVYPGMLGVL